MKHLAYAYFACVGRNCRPGDDSAYRREIDGLRAVSVLAVMLYHAGIGPFSGGYVGVDVFFVISGYLISGIVFRQLDIGDLKIIDFLERRVRRICPALFLVLFTCLPFAWLLFLPEELRQFSGSLVSSILFSANLWFWRLPDGYFGPIGETMPLLHLWSLAIEEQFYLLFPILLLLLWRFARGGTLGILLAFFIASLALCIATQLWAPKSSFYLLPMRAWELLAGVMLSYVGVTRIRAVTAAHWNEILAVAGLMAILFPIFLVDSGAGFPWPWALPVVAGTIVLLIFAPSSRLVGGLLASRPLVGLGLISYSAYLWHQPVLVFGRSARLNALSAVESLGLLALSLLLAVASWKLVEHPFRSRHFLSRIQVFSAGIAGAGLLCLAGLAGWYTNGFSERFSTRDGEIASMGQQYAADLSVCMDPLIATKPSARCILGSRVPASVVLLGDSHAASIIPVLKGSILAKSQSTVVMTHAACPPILDIAALPPSERSCAHYNRAAIAEITANPAIKTVIVGARWTYYLQRSWFDNGEGGVEIGPKHDKPSPAQMAQMAAAYRQMVEAVLRSGRHVVLIYPIPEQGWNVPRRLVMARRLGWAESEISTSAARFNIRNAQAYQALDAIGHSSQITRLYPGRQLCNTVKVNRCVGTISGSPLYFDDNHLSSLGATIALPELPGILQNRAGIR